MTRTSRPGPKRAVNIRSAIASTVAQRAPGLDDETIGAITGAVVHVLSDPQVVNQLAEIVHESLLSSSHFRDEFADTTERFWDSRDCAEMAVGTTLDVIAEREKVLFTVADAPQVHTVLRGLVYRDWHFDLVRNGERIGVRVSATVPNAADPTRGFSTSRTAVITDDIMEAAFRAIMQLEEHEARERLTAGDSRPLDPHDGSSSMPPFNSGAT